MSISFNQIKKFKVFTIEVENFRGQLERVSGKVVFISKNRDLITLLNEDKQISFYDWEVTNIWEGVKSVEGEAAAAGPVI